MEIIMKKQLLAAVLTASFSGFVFAAPPVFSDVDTNADGMISPTEAQVVEGLDFTAADTDENGSLSEAEYLDAIAS
ncbi:MAG: hypothetical protein ACI8W7_000156 [Gammaproteobacteria bacterium]|jgi:hypothetical protein